LDTRRKDRQKMNKDCGMMEEEREKGGANIELNPPFKKKKALYNKKTISKI